MAYGTNYTLTHKLAHDNTVSNKWASQSQAIWTPASPCQLREKTNTVRPTYLLPIGWQDY